METMSPGEVAFRDQIRFGLQPVLHIMPARRTLVRAGQLLKIEVLDHLVIGRGEHKSLRALGCMCE